MITVSNLAKLKIKEMIVNNLGKAALLYINGSRSDSTWLECAHKETASTTGHGAESGGRAQSACRSQRPAAPRFAHVRRERLESAHNQDTCRQAEGRAARSSDAAGPLFYGFQCRMSYIVGAVGAPWSPKAPAYSYLASRSIYNSLIWPDILYFVRYISGHCHANQRYFHWDFQL